MPPVATGDPAVAPPRRRFPIQLARALAYEHGEGVPKDQKLAAALYCDAAVARQCRSAFQLGWMYANGRGVAHDDGTAAALFELAAGEGHAYARTVLQRIGDVQGVLPDCMRPRRAAGAPDPPSRGGGATMPIRSATCRRTSRRSPTS